MLPRATRSCPLEGPAPTGRPAGTGTTGRHRRRTVWHSFAALPWRHSAGLPGGTAVVAVVKGTVDTWQRGSEGRAHRHRRGGWDAPVPPRIFSPNLVGVGNTLST